MVKTEKEKIIEEVLKILKKKGLDTEVEDGFTNRYWEQDVIKAIKKALQSQKQEFIEEIKKSREKLADLEHQQWSHLIKYLASNPSGNIIDLINRYDSLAEIPYEDLLEKDKEKDRVWADKVIEELLKVIGEKE